MKKDEVVRRRNLKHGDLEAMDMVKMADGSELEVPIYDRNWLKGSHCARFARTVAGYTSGKDYEPSDAWNMRHKHNTVMVYNFEKQVERGEIEPGDLVGIRRPFSNYRNRVDSTGEKAAYTHMTVFLGEDARGDLRFAEQVGENSGTTTLSSIRMRLGRPVEVIKALRDAA
tara:strand:+ start:571 stop:1083 length:513 start_codon:yes stop_codon:yes gene_type:complete